METIKSLESKYSQASKSTDASLPIELSNDLNKITKVISDTKDTNVLKLCDSMKSRLSERLKFFQEKLKKHPKPKLHGRK